MKSKDRFEVLLEDVQGKISAVGEGVDALQGVPSRLDRIEDRLESLGVKMDVLVPTVKDHSGRITRLEDKVFGK